MKKFYLLLTLLVVGFSAKAAPAAAEVNFERRNFGDAFIFVERGVEFAVFPDGQFDFFFNPRGNFNRIPSHINYSFNSGYNYGPFIQYDDYGAVIQIENVPVYYDYYGRIVQAGRVQIRYNAFGMVNRIGNMFVHYNPYHNFSHTSGYINGRNVRYVYRPWHDHYMRPYAHYSVVYNEPYRLYYHPNRMKYSAYKRYYQNNYYNTNNFQKSYYKPGDRVTSYHRGRRVEEPREVRRHYSDSRATANSVDSRSSYEQREVRRTPVATQRSERTTRSSRVETPAVQQRAEQQRAVQQRVEEQREEQRRRVRESRSRSTSTQSGVQQQTRRSVHATPAREVRAQAQTRKVERSATVDPVTEESTPASTRGTRSSRRGN
ncbi:hypothetical protein ACXYMT_10850 [Salinimicrobium sp. CAU 1759]